jgi:hypothetical protein
MAVRCRTRGGAEWGAGLTRRRALPTNVAVPRLALCVLVLLLAAPATASADPYLPPKGKIWHGLTAGSSAGDFERIIGKHPAIWQHFVLWGTDYSYAFRRSASAKARLMLSISTADGQHARGRITPGAIARGEGDNHLLWLNRRLAEHGEPSYLRVFGEMNNCDNAYAALNCNGSRRSADHSAARFKQAWKRIFLIVKGGSVERIDARLEALGLPRLDTDRAELPRAPVAILWSPMTGGSPMVAALDPRVYWPGRAWVDWVGTSFYSRYPNFHYLEPFYKRYAVGHKKPFAFAEWAMWGGDSATFARRLFKWIRTHKRVRMVQYNQGELTDGPFRLGQFPGARKVIRGALKSPVFQAWAPEHR